MCVCVCALVCSNAEAIIVTPRSFEDEIRSTLVDKCGLKIKLIFESINDSQLEDYGTAQTLRLVRPKIPVSTWVIVHGGMSFPLPRYL